MSNRMLIIKDDTELCRALVRRYRKKEWQVEVAANTEEAKKFFIQKHYDPHVVVADLGLPDGNILDHMEDLNDYSDFSDWIFLFEEGRSVDFKRIEDIAYDYFVKPPDQQRLDIVVSRALRSSLTSRRLHSHSAANSERYPFEAYIGRSEAVKQVREMLKQLAGVPLSTMIITGETGTGKGLVARVVHHSGQRRGGPLVELNCAALPKELLESQLFGHEAGAFTGAKTRHRGLFEQADGGTLFLDEIGDMDLELQAKLLKAIEDKKIRRLGSERVVNVDVQIIAATSSDLTEATQAGRFRDDLYHRLSVFCVKLPPLRQRKEDLVELVPRIIAEFNAKANKRIDIIPDSVWEKLLRYDWPGNVRELRNVIERCVLLSQDEVLPEQWLQLPDAGITEPESGADVGEDYIKVPIDGSMRLDEMDSFIIKTALERNHHNVTETARMLGTTRETLRYRIQKYKLDIPA